MSISKSAAKDLIVILTLSIAKSHCHSDPEHSEGEESNCHSIVILNPEHSEGEESYCYCRYYFLGSFPFAMLRAQDDGLLKIFPLRYAQGSR